MKQASIKDIARKPGVSVSAVSRALSGRPDISKDTRLRVESLAREPDYHPDALNKSLQHKQTQVIGVVISHRIASGLLISVAVTTHSCDHFVRLKRRGVPVMFFEQVCSEIVSSPTTVRHPAYEI